MADLVIELLGEGPSLLETDDIGLLGCEPVGKPLAPTGAESVDVPAKEADGG